MSQALPCLDGQLDLLAVLAAAFDDDLDGFPGRGPAGESLQAAQAHRRLRLPVEARPDHLVLREVDLHAVPGQDVVADDAVQLGAGEAHAVHALELERRLDPDAGLVQDDAALDLEAVYRAPAVL